MDFITNSDSLKNKQYILKVFLISHLHQLFYDLFKNKLNEDVKLKECYTMDNKIIQYIIKDILDTGNYTLEGIANYTHIPFDVVYDAACGFNNQISITSWVRIINLYLQVKPNIEILLSQKLLEFNLRKSPSISSLLK